MSARTAALMAERIEAWFSCRRARCAGKVEQRLFLVDFGQRLRDGAQGEEFAIGVEIVVLAFVGRVGGSVFT